MGVSRAGQYRIEAHLGDGFAADATGLRAFQILTGFGIVPATTMVPSDGAAARTPVSVTATDLVEGEAITIRAWQNSGGAARIPESQRDSRRHRRPRRPSGLMITAEDSAFRTAFAVALARKGVDVARRDTGYVNDPDDPWGATNYGVTQAVYNAYLRQRGALQQPVRAIALEEVEAIYRRNYWRDAQCDTFAEARHVLALAHFDAAVNLGACPAARHLQRAAGVASDGIIGRRTIAAATT